MNINENSQVWDKQQTITEIVAHNQNLISEAGAKSDRKFSLNIERVDHANSQDDLQEPMMLDEGSNREQSQDIEPRSESK